MPRNSAIPPENLDEILAWLHPDREVAAAMHVRLRHDLEKIFLWAHCADPEGLTDETIDRVAKKVHDLRQTYVGDPRLYFLGVAKNLIKEYSRTVKNHLSLEDTIEAADRIAEPGEESVDMREECLRSCLQQLSSKKRELIVNYYANEKQAKVAQRAKLAQRLDTSVETLRVRVFRIRKALESCIERCLDQKTGGNETDRLKIHCKGARGSLEDAHERRDGN